MTTWLPRGLVFAIGMVLLRLVQGTLINTYPTKAGSISLGLVVIFGVAAFAWALLDGMADARANPDPDRRRDLAMRWLLAGLFAGVVSGLAVWAISLFYKAVYAEGIVPNCRFSRRSRRYWCSFRRCWPWLWGAGWWIAPGHPRRAAASLTESRPTCSTRCVTTIHGPVPSRRSLSRLPVLPPWTTRRLTRPR